MSCRALPLMQHCPGGTKAVGGCFQQCRISVGHCFVLRVASPPLKHNPSLRLQPCSAERVRDKYRNRYEVERERTEELLKLAELRIHSNIRGATWKSLILYLPGWFWYKVMPDLPKYIIFVLLRFVWGVYWSIRRALFWIGLRFEASLIRPPATLSVARVLRRWHGKERILDRLLYRWDLIPRKP